MRSLGLCRPFGANSGDRARSGFQYPTGGHNGISSLLGTHKGSTTLSMACKAQL